MLVLSRRIGEQVVLVLPDGQHITVMYCSNVRAQIQLGFDAPADVKIYRSEILPESLTKPVESTP